MRSGWNSYQPKINAEAATLLSREHHPILDTKYSEVPGDEYAPSTMPGTYLWNFEPPMGLKYGWLPADQVA